jgi:GPI mannosyltransferase 3
LAFESGQSLAVYRDQTDIFFEDPLKYLTTRFPSTVDLSFPPSPYPSVIPGETEKTHSEISLWRHEWPKYLVMFGSLTERYGIVNLLTEKGYGEVLRISNGWEEDDKRKGGVRVWRHQS